MKKDSLFFQFLRKAKACDLHVRLFLHTGVLEMYRIVLSLEHNFPPAGSKSTT